MFVGFSGGAGADASAPPSSSFTESLRSSVTFLGGAQDAEVYRVLRTFLFFLLLRDLPPDIAELFTPLFFLMSHKGLNKKG